MNLEDHFALVVLAVVVVVTLACFVVLALVGGDGETVLRDVLLAEVGGLLGVSIPRQVK